MNLWPVKNLRVFWDAATFGAASEHLHRIWIQALSEIEGVCGMTFTEVTSSEGANIVAFAGSIDGPLEDLALTQLPGPGITATSQLTQKFDAADLPTEGDQELLVEFLHECGHFLGRDHSPANVSSVMSAYIDMNLTGLTAYDEAQLQAMYGPPAPAPPDDANKFLQFQGVVLGSYHPDKGSQVVVTMPGGRLVLTFEPNS